MDTINKIGKLTLVNIQFLKSQNFTTPHLFLIYKYSYKCRLKFSCLTLSFKLSICVGMIHDLWGINFTLQMKKKCYQQVINQLINCLCMVTYRFRQCHIQWVAKVFIPLGIFPLNFVIGPAPKASCHSCGR